MSMHMMHSPQSASHTCSSSALPCTRPSVQQRCSSLARSERDSAGVRTPTQNGMVDLRHCLAGVAAAALLSVSGPCWAAKGAARLPPIDKDPARCERAYVGNTIGQANAVADKLLDLRQCKFPGADFSSKVLSGGLMSDADFSNTKLVETVLTKVYAVGADFSGANFQNAVVDRGDFRRANMRGAKFRNTVITGSVFEEADLTGATFDDALIGYEDVKRLCANPTLGAEAKAEVGCRTNIRS